MTHRYGRFVSFLNVPISNESICLVDDDVSVLRGLSRLLRSVGLVNQIFSSPIQFIEYAKSHRVPVAVLDINMPEMNGLEVFKWLRSASMNSRVIFITGMNNPEAQATAIAQGAIAVFPKPCTDEAFLETIRAALADSRKYQE